MKKPSRKNFDSDEEFFTVYRYYLQTRRYIVVDEKDGRPMSFYFPNKDLPHEGQFCFCDSKFPVQTYTKREFEIHKKLSDKYRVGLCETKYKILPVG